MTKMKRDRISQFVICWRGTVGLYGEDDMMGPSQGRRGRCEGESD
jgi:hypothetical protein